MSHILKEISKGDEQLLGQEPVIAKLYRFDPDSSGESSLVQYIVPYKQRMSVFTLLRELYESQDPTIAFRNQQCGRGVCGTCRVRVTLDRLNLKAKLVTGCSIVLQPGDQITIEPAFEHKVIRDLAVDF